MGINAPYTNNGTKEANEMKRTEVYRNKRNENKYIEVVRYGSGNYYAVQFMRWGGIVNKLGSRTGCRSRFTKASLANILEDYVKVA